MPKYTDHDERRKAIIAATWRLIAEHGIQGANMRDIAIAAGYAKPAAVLHYFANKKDILGAAYQYVYTATNQRITQRLVQLPEPTPRQAIDIMCDELLPLDPLTELEGRVALVFWQESLADEDFARLGREALQSWVKELTQHLTRALEAGQLRSSVVPNQLSAQLGAMVMGLLVFNALDQQNYDAERQRSLLMSSLDRHFI